MVSPQFMVNTKLLLTSWAETPLFKALTGEVYTTFGDAMKMTDGTVSMGPRQFMIKTADLSQFLELVEGAKKAWDRAKEVEKMANT